MKPSQFHWIGASSEKVFFVALGKRIAELRRAQGLTQQQLAEQLGIAQQTLAHYEGAKLRVPASMLPQLAQIFSVPVDALLGQTVKEKSKRGPATQLQRSIERISELPKPKQRFVMEMLETVLAQAGR